MRRQSSIRHLVGFLAATAALLLTTTPLFAQGHTSSRPDSVRHIQKVEPRSGPPGTTVEVETLNLPFEARVHLGIGATADGFESLAELQQDSLGGIATTVRIPGRASWDQPLVFIAFNAIFAPIGRSHPFHVTDDRGWVQRTGTVIERAGPCTLFRDRDGFDYALVGNAGSVPLGQELVLSGRYLQTSVCSDVTDSIEVSR